MLKTEKTKPEVLEAHYGSAEPEKVLRVLHRDAILAQEKSIGEDVYEKPISEVSWTSAHLPRKKLQGRGEKDRERGRGIEGEKALPSSFVCFDVFFQVQNC
jgi:hypothetical protein